MELTKNFKLSEFDCNDGTKVPKELRDNCKIIAINLQRLRDIFNEPITITSGYRTYEHNIRVNGAKGSYHLKAQAADFKMHKIKIIKVFEKMIEMIAESKIRKGEIIIYDKFIHYAPFGDLRIKIKTTENKEKIDQTK